MTSLEKNTETKLTLDVKEAGGKTNGTVDLPAEIFDAPANIALLHQVVIAQLAAARQGTHSTKTRGEVRGGGKKPYRQKGTGRARQGSTRAPQFVGGGTVHGPQPRDYSQRTPKKMKAAALRGALSDRARSERLHVITELVAGQVPSTKGAKTFLAERAVWWPGPTAASWYEAHVSTGASDTAARWAVAETEHAAGGAVSTYVLVANTGEVGTDARVTWYGEQGESSSAQVTLPPSSRTTLDLSAVFPQHAGRGSVVVESLSAVNSLVVERALYRTVGGVFWAAGAASQGVPLP